MWRWDLPQRGEVQLGCIPLSAPGDGSCSWQSSDPVRWDAAGGSVPVRSVVLVALAIPQHLPFSTHLGAFLLLEVENAESCHGHNAYPKSQCPHSVIPCPSFPLYFLASGLLLSWCDTVCTWVLFVLLREKVKGRRARGCVSGRFSLACTRCSLPTRYLSAP